MKRSLARFGDRVRLLMPRTKGQKHIEAFQAIDRGGMGRKLGKHAQLHQRHHYTKHQLSPNHTFAHNIKMRAASRLLAEIKPSRFLEPGAPTGLTGLLTHNSPRSALLYLYNSTLDKLQHIPESSVYRQSTEALTKHRLKIIENAKPPGWDEWSAKIQEQIAADPKGFKATQTSAGVMLSIEPQEDINPKLKKSEWDGELVGKSFPEGIRSQAARHAFIAQLAGPKDYDPERANTKLKLDDEPQLTAEVYVKSIVRVSAIIRC